MASFKFPPLASVHTMADGDNAFDDDSAGPDSLIVNFGAFLVTEGALAFGAYLNNSDAWSVTVNGSIFSKQWIGIELLSANSTVTIGREGEVFGGSSGIHVASSATIHNAGVISGSARGIDLEGAGTVTIINTGTISGAYSIFDGAGNTDKITNSGIIEGATGTLHLGDGDDRLVNFRHVGSKLISGTILGVIEPGNGNDTFLGGNKSETATGGPGQDTYKFGGGNDTYHAVGDGGETQIDVVDGGAGLDLYSLGFGPGSINLDSKPHFFEFAAVAPNTALGGDFGTDKITGFENANGGAGSDLIFGSDVANTLDGAASNDVLVGLAGNDKLIGGSGQDRLWGGKGADFLDGGSDDDAFLYTSIKDSGLTKATRDVIAFFEDNHDIIDLSEIDAISTNAANTNDGFTFIGTSVNFTGQAGQLRAYFTATGQVVEGDINGDKLADFSIAIQDPNHTIVLTGSDFEL
jgi:serralysin